VTECLISLGLESRSDIPQTSILRYKLWYDDTFIQSHPKIKGDQNKANQFIAKTLEVIQELLCLDSLDGQIVMEVSFDFSTSFFIPISTCLTAFVGG